MWLLAQFQLHTLLNEPRVIYLPSKERNFALLLYFPKPHADGHRMLYGIIQNSHLGVVVRVEFPDELQYLRSEAGRVVSPALRRAEVAFVLALPSAVHAAPLVRVLCQHIYRLLFQPSFFYNLQANSQSLHSLGRPQMQSFGIGLQGNSWFATLRVCSELLARLFGT